MTSLNHDFAILLNWFYKKFMFLSPNKCSFILFGVKDELQQISYLTTLLLKSKDEEVRGNHQ